MVTVESIINWIEVIKIAEYQESCGRLDLGPRKAGIVQRMDSTSGRLSTSLNDHEVLQHNNAHSF